jgi:hypothetical protein
LKGFYVCGLRELL